MATCADCKWWAEDAELTHGEQKGRCTLHPPVLTCRCIWDFDWQQPHTAADTQACGDFKTAPPVPV